MPGVRHHRAGSPLHRHPREVSILVRLCSVESCGNKHHSHGFCTGHRKRASLGQDLHAPLRARYRDDDQCSVEGCTRSPKARGLCGMHYLNQLNEQGYARNRSLVLKYGITLSDLREMLGVQDYLCAICGDLITERTSHVDHDHVCCDGPNTCGKCLRGVLCPSCNMGLGLFKDSIENLQKAVNYLDEWKKRRERSNSNPVRN